MTRLNTIAAPALCGCVEHQQTTRAADTGQRQAGSNAESACMQVVNNTHGGKVANLVVTSSEISQEMGF